MPVNRSLGGIGKLYRGDLLVGQVYYNIRQDSPRASQQEPQLDAQPSSLVGSVVFVDVEVELPNDNYPYRLELEDMRHVVLTIRRSSSTPFSAWACVSCDGMIHPHLSYSYS